MIFLIAFHFYVFICVTYLILLSDGIIYPGLTKKRLLECILAAIAIASVWELSLIAITLKAAIDDPPHLIKWYRKFKALPWKD